MKEAFLSDLLSNCLFLSSFFIFLLTFDYLDCNVLSLLPLNCISVALGDVISIKVELFYYGSVGEPFILGEIKLNAKLASIGCLRTFNPLQMLKNVLVVFGNLKSKLTVLENLQPILLELLCCYVMHSSGKLLLSEDALNIVLRGQCPLAFNNLINLSSIWEIPRREEAESSICT